MKIDAVGKANTWSHENMIKHWESFSEQLKTDKKINLHNIFERYKPQKQENNISVEVINKSEQAAINEIKPELLPLG